MVSIWHHKIISIYYLSKSEYLERNFCINEVTKYLIVGLFQLYFIKNQIKIGQAVLSIWIFDKCTWISIYLYYLHIWD